MSHRTTPPQRLPTLTEVIEYDGEMVRVRSIAEPEPEPEAQDAEAAPPQAADVPVLPIPDGATHQRSREIDDLVCRHFDESLEPRLRSALEPLFEQLLQRAIAEVRLGLAETVGRLGETSTQWAEIVSTRQRPPALDDGGDAAP